MAKKKEALTPEERLQAALVPENERPYKVPENWCWVHLGQLGYTNIGLTYKPKDICETGTIVLRSGNIQDAKMDYSDIIRVNTPIPESKMSKKGDILICARNGSKNLVGKAAIIDMDGMSYGAFMAIFRSPYNSLIFYYFNSPYFRGCIDRDVGTTTINQLTQGIIKDLPFPLPPLSEQQRIVDRIESLFAKLDEAKQKAQDALDSFEPRKAAILHKAFTGELTTQWRKEHGVGMESWAKVKFGELGTLERGRSKHRPRNDPKLFGGNYPFIQTGDIANSGMYITEHKQNLSDFGKEQSKIFPKGTLCITIAANIGDVAILSYDCCFPDSVVGFTPNELSNSEFMYYMMGTLQDELEANAPATAQKNINLKVLNDLTIIIPTILEQLEIVRILDSLLAKEQQAKEAAEAVLEQIDLIKKSILARAFRGELGTNDPSEESAVELLRAIL